MTARESAVAEALIPLLSRGPSGRWMLKDRLDPDDLAAAVLAALDSAPQPPQPTPPAQAEAVAALSTCDQDHGGEGNAATVYGHHASRRTCIRLRDSDLWVYDSRWEDPR